MRIPVYSSRTKSTVSRFKNSAAFWTEGCQSALIQVMIIRIVKESCNPGHLGVTARRGCSRWLSLTIDTPADRQGSGILCGTDDSRRHYPVTTTVFCTVFPLTMSINVNVHELICTHWRNENGTKEHYTHRSWRASASP